MEGRRLEGALAEDTVRSAVEGLAGTLGFRAKSPATLEGTVYRTSGSDVIVKGTLSVTVEFDCARCLESRTLTSQMAVDHMLVKRVKASSATAEELIIDEALLDEPDIEGYDGEQIDLNGLMNEDVVLAMPMNPTCDDVEGATCAPMTEQQPLEATIDPRWAPLLELKKKMN